MKYFIGISLFILNFCDGIFTQYAITHLGAVEVNPIVGFLINNLGIYWVIPKVLYSIIPILFIIKYWNEFFMAKLVGIIIFCLYFLVVLYQVIMIFII